MDSLWPKAKILLLFLKGFTLFKLMDYINESLVPLLAAYFKKLSPQIYMYKMSIKFHVQKFTILVFVIEKNLQKVLDSLMYLVLHKII